MAVESLFSVPGLGMTLQPPTELREPSENDYDHGYSLIEIESSIPVFKEISVDFKNAGLKVLKIERLGNHLLWQKYEAEKRTMTTRKPKDPKFELNEKYLYHGTSADVDYICTEGLDHRISKKGGHFGQGVYFSDNPMKCVKYAEKSTNTPFIIMARVILGCPKVYPKGEKDRLLTREPPRKKPFKGWRFHDSVVGTPKDYKEFVIYRNDKALIECIITYSKDTITRIPPVSRSCASTSPVQYDPKQGVFTNTKKYGNEDNSDTSDDDKDSESSDSDDSDEREVLGKADGNSSDSSVEQDNNDVASCRPKANTVLQSAIREKSGVEILADKKKEFMLQTGEKRPHVIESYLSTTGLDVKKAVELFMNKEQKRLDMEKEQRQREMEKELADKETNVYENAACGATNATDKPEDWEQMQPKDKEAIVDGLVDNFLVIVGLEDNSDNRKLSKKVISSCNYDLDNSILNYYESLQFVS